MPGIFDQLGSLATGVASLAIVLVVAFLIMSQGKTQTGQIEGFDPSNATQCQTSVACNATNTLQLAVDDIPGWIPLVIVAAIGSILLGLVAMFRGR
tara:strand:- start:65 stop:352 length:288 start_codon:yes stop_codon:yes gene_type:complete